MPAHLAARRAPRDELRVETGSYPARRLPRSPLAGLVRTDRGSVWRAVPMRRGLAVLAIGPGVVALAGDLDWPPDDDPARAWWPPAARCCSASTPGASTPAAACGGRACRSAPATVFAARTWVLTEFLLVASFVTMVLAGLRAGLPTRRRAHRAAVHLGGRRPPGGLLGDALVVAATVRRRPALRPRHAGAAAGDGRLLDQARGHHHADQPDLLRASRGCRHPEVSVLVAAPFVAWSLVRLLHARDAWTDPVQRARVVTTVAA